MKFKIGDRVKYVGIICTEVRGVEGIILSIGTNACSTKVSFNGEKTPYTCFSTSLELIKEDDMETSIKTVYKAMRIDKGVLKSVYAGHYTGNHFIEDLRGVVYKEGQIAHAPEGQKGLSTWDTFEQARLFCESNRYSAMVVHEATPLGDVGEGLMDDLGSATYPAILLGKEVWRDNELETIEPALEEWVDVTKECVIDFLEAHANEGGQTIQVNHNGSQVARFGIGVPYISNKSNYKVEEVSYDYLDGMSTFKVLKRITI